MIHILLAGKDTTSLSALKTALTQRDADVEYIVSRRGVLEAISTTVFDLLVVDEILEDMSGVELIKLVTTRQPLLNCALVSSLSSEKFHEATEGLGVLMSLSPHPGINEADQLLRRLNKILSFSTGPATKES